MKRQRGRNRGGGGGGKPNQNVNRAFESTGPENVKIRGHAQHVFEKYQQLARDAFSSGDRVLAENYLQHAEHYFRVLRTLQPQRPAAEILGRDVFASGMDIDFEEEPGEALDEGAADAMAAAEAGGEPRPEGGYEQRPREGRYDQPRGEGRQDYEGREGRRDERGFEGRRDGYDSRREGREGYENRREGQERGEGRRDFEGRRDREGRRYEGRRDERFEGGRGERGFNREGREDRYEGRRDERRYEGRRDERPYEDRRPERYEPREPAAEAESQPQPYVESPEPRGESEGSTVLRSEDGGVSQAPAFLQTSTTGEDGEPRRRPRRRRPRSFEANAEGGEGETPVEAEEA